MQPQTSLDQAPSDFTTDQSLTTQQLKPTSEQQDREQSSVGHATDMAVASSLSHRSVGPSTRHRDSLPRAFYDLPAGNDTAYINRRVHYGSGQFCGRVVRIELHELQKAELGRKYARVDRRPLDPPPVVQMRIYEVFDVDSGREIEQEIPNYDSIEVHGFIGMVDLFPVQRSEKEPRKNPKRTQQPSSPPLSRAGPVPPPQYQPPSTAETETQTLAPSHGPDRGFKSQTAVSGEPNDDGDVSGVVHHVDGLPIRESSKMTHALVGATFVEPVAIDWQGQKSLMFVFADLAVKTEGYFILRYRVFNIFSAPIGHPERIIQAECYGGVFRVYSTKEFPGLQASTELTKQLARWGVRLNIREVERKRRRKDDSRSHSPVASVSAPLLLQTAAEETSTAAAKANSTSAEGSGTGKQIPSERLACTSAPKRPRLSPTYERQHADDSQAKSSNP